MLYKESETNAVDIAIVQHRFQVADPAVNHRRSKYFKNTAEPESRTTSDNPSVMSAIASGSGSHHVVHYRRVSSPPRRSMPSQINFNLARLGSIIANVVRLVS